MAGFNGEAFLLGIQHLDVATRELFDQHGQNFDGRRALVEQITDEAMLRLMSSELHRNPDDVDRAL